MSIAPCRTRAYHVIAFFEHSPDSVFGVVNRSDFQTRLHLHLGGSNTNEENAAWYALRNIIYAIGCRSAASVDKSQDFVEIQMESLRYFHNAFSVYADLLYMPSGLMAVQALIMMVSFFWHLGKFPVNKTFRPRTPRFWGVQLLNTCSVPPRRGLHSQRGFTENHQRHGSSLYQKCCIETAFFGPFTATRNA